MWRLDRRAMAMLRDERGATAIEYALLASLIAGALIAITATLGQTVRDAYTLVGTELDAALLAQQP